MPDLKTRCERCRHTFSFHQKRMGASCKATGCHASAGEACEGFVAPAQDKSLSTPA